MAVGDCGLTWMYKVANYVTLCSIVVTVCTAQWSLYVPHSGHYMYHTVVTICTAQWSLCTAQWSLCTAQWSLNVRHSGHYMYRTVVNICTTSLTFSNSTFCRHSVFMCFVWIWEQTANISLYSINWLVCVTERECLLRGTDWVFIYNSTFCPHSCIYVFCVDLRTNSDYFPIQH